MATDIDQLNTELAVENILHKLEDWGGDSENSDFPVPIGDFARELMTALEGNISLPKKIRVYLAEVVRRFDEGRLQRKAGRPPKTWMELAPREVRDSIAFSTFLRILPKVKKEPRRPDGAIVPWEEAYTETADYLNEEFGTDFWTSDKVKHAVRRSRNLEGVSKPLKI